MSGWNRIAALAACALMVLVSGCGEDRNDAESPSQGNAIGMLGFKIGDKVDVNDPSFREKYKISIEEREGEKDIFCSFTGSKTFRCFTNGEMRIDADTCRITRLTVRAERKHDRNEREWYALETILCQELFNEKYGGSWEEDKGEYWLRYSCNINGGFIIVIRGVSTARAVGGDEPDSVTIHMFDESAVKKWRKNSMKKDLDALE